MMNEVGAKREKILRDLRKKNRDEIRGVIRETALSKLNSIERPLISDVFQDFDECTHWDLIQEDESLCSAIENCRAQELSDWQHHNFITDLYYLLHENIITLPPGTSFKKNEDGYTASLVSMVSNEIDEDELCYWIEYMQDEAKEIMLLSIAVQDESHVRWIRNPRLYAFLLQNVKWMNAAAETFKELLMFSEEMTKKNIDESISYVQQGLKYQLQQNNIQFLRNLTEIWITLIKIYAKLQFHKDQTDHMIAFLKEIILKDIKVLMGVGIVQDLNELYEMIREDFIVDDRGCEKLLEEYWILLKKGGQEVVNSDQNLFKNYLFRLFHNNWRAKQVKDRGYFYSQQFYQLLEIVNNQDQSNPFFSKLQNIRRK